MTAFFECGPFDARTKEGRVLLEEVSLVLHERLCVCIEGPSGSGKSTLLRHVTALAWSPGATRRLSKEEFSAVDLPRWRSRVCLMAQDAPMIRGTVLDNLAFPFRHRSAKNRSLDEHVARGLLGGIGLGELPFDRDVAQLSGGERHRLALVRGLLWDPPVLVADEVLSGLDPETAEVCLQLLLGYARKPGRLLICVLHDPSLCRHADRRLFLQGGCLEEH